MCIGFRDVIGVEGPGPLVGGVSSGSWKNQANSQVRMPLFVTARLWDKDSARAFMPPPHTGGASEYNLNGKPALSKRERGRL